MRRKFILMLLLLLFIAPPVFAEDNGKLSSFIHDVEAKAATVKTLTCILKQERHLAIFARPVIFQGRMALEKPDKLRWEFTSPIASVLIFNGTKGLKCSGNSEPQRFNLATDPIMQMVSKQIWTWVNGSYTTLQEQYHMVLLEPDPCLVLTANDPKISRAISSVKISFNPDSLQPTTVRIQEPGGDHTVISFSDFILNQPLDQSLFTRCSSP
ncbi:MAG: outer membrane lipoprotein carrier protein LolA [Thermodesulfobacteriota bacterium]|nr:outer membrane lipoprotein carrier protein LolA [Thermodesulfobacteriota bacterium]